MKKIMHLLLLSCKKATELIEKKSLVGLSFRERVQLNIHKSVCEACTAYEKQSIKIDELMQKHIQAEGSGPDNTGSNTQLKEKIITKLPQT
ncbi:MAG TPA: hypothetical protein PKI55_00970 [Chitinophagaceae bacterium]|nr:hypothetical protein [Chitinophagaceae bacterium]